MNPEQVRRFEAALHSEKPFHELFDLPVALRDEGVSQLDIYMLYEHFLKEAPVNSEAYDWIYEVMDFIWCYPPYTKGNGLFDHQLTNQEVEEYRAKAG